MTTPGIRGTPTTANSTSPSFTCNKPADVVEGDLLLSLQFSDGSIGATPSGWTQLQAITSEIGSRVAYKVAGGGEPATYTFSQPSSPDGGAIIIALAGAALSTPVSAQASSLVTPSVVPEGVDDLEVRFAAAAFYASSFTPPSGLTERADVTSGGNSAGTVATRVLTSGAATGTATFVASPSSPLFAHGYTVTVTGRQDSSGRRLLVATSVAVHRGAW